jgi:hypothetical protein
MKWWIEPAAVALGVIIVVVFVVLMIGVGLRVSQGGEAAPPPVTEGSIVTEIPTTIPTPLPETTTPAPEVATTAPTPTPRTGTYAEAATPYHDKKYYKLPYRSTIYDPRGSTPPVIFQQSYRFDFQDEAVVANVAKAPLIIDFTLTRSVSPTRSFFYLTIRNNATQELLAQEGFYGPYSEDRSKRLYFSSPGSYHINMHGGFVSVTLTLRAPAA